MSDRVTKLLAELHEQGVAKVVIEPSTNEVTFWFYNGKHTHVGLWGRGIEKRLKDMLYVLKEKNRRGDE